MQNALERNVCAVHRARIILILRQHRTVEFLRELQLFREQDGQVATAPLWLLPDGRVLVEDKDATVILESEIFLAFLDSESVHGIAILGQGNEPNRFGTVSDVQSVWPPPEVKGFEIQEKFKEFLLESNRVEETNPQSDDSSEGGTNPVTTEEVIDGLASVDSTLPSVRVNLDFEDSSPLKLPKEVLLDHVMSRPMVEMYGMTGVRLKTVILFGSQPLPLVEWKELFNSERPPRAPNINPVMLYEKRHPRFTIFKPYGLGESALPDLG